MKRKRRIFLSLSTACLVLTLSAYWTLPARADGGAPPPAASPAQTQTTPSTTQNGPSVLSRLPANTQVVVRDGGGHRLPLGSEQAASIVEATGTIWCPSTVLVPVSGAANCISSDSLAALIGSLDTKPAANGTIWIEKDYVSSSPSADPGVTLFAINGSSLTGLSNYTLTIKGGWNGSGTGTVDITDPSVFDGAALAITSWNNNVTINDILIQNVGGSGSTALMVTNTRNISLNRVTVGDPLGVNANEGDGALLMNTTGAGTVSVASSTFAHNSTGAGLVVLAKGTISLKDITADNNGSNGADLDNCLWNGTICSAVGNVSLSGINTFSENGGHGLAVHTKGAIAAGNLIANNNTGTGAHLDNCAYDGMTCGLATVMPVTLSGSSQFKFNDIYGLQVFSNGPITANNLTATNNGATGARLDNAFSTVGASLTLTGTNLFNDNEGGGLAALSKGAMTLNNLMADGNQDGGGVFLDNHAASIPKAVTLTGTNEMISNYLDGLVIQSKGPVAINNLTSSENQAGSGAQIDNIYSGNLSPQNVTLSGFARFIHNGVDGLSLETHGAITVANLTAGNNGWAGEGNGAVLDNYQGGSSTIPKAVTLTGTQNLYNNQGTGLRVDSLGAIALSNLSTSGNVVDGAYLGNDYGNAAVTLSGYQKIQDNGYSGLLVFSKGNITLSNLSVWGNGTAQIPNSGFGVYLVNAFSGSAGNVTVSGYGSFGDNFNSGLEVRSQGAVTLANLQAESNGLSNGVNPVYGYGVLVSNENAASPKPVTLLGWNTFSGNYNGGLKVISQGLIKASNLTAETTTNGWGVDLNNYMSSSSLGVTLSGYNTLNNNSYGGLTVNTQGAILASNLTVEGSTNSEEAVCLTNIHVSGSGPGVTLTGQNTINQNTGWGLHVVSSGPVNLNSLTANDNGWVLTDGYGINVMTDNSITLTGTNTFNHNYTGGILLGAKGALKVNNLNANNNHGYGALLVNSGSSTHAGFLLTGGAYTTGNGAFGMEVDSKGAISFNLSDAWIDGNGSFGWSLNNSIPGSLGGVTLNVAPANHIDFTNNGAWGLSIQSIGNIYTFNLDASGNAGAGAILTNAVGGSTGTLTLNSIGDHNTFSGNHTDGLLATSNRAITITNLTADSNGFGGASLDNAANPASPQNVTLNGHGSFSSNGYTGLQVSSFGAITVNNVSAKNNGTLHSASPGTGDGILLDNCLYHSGVGMCTGVPAKAVTINGLNTANNNYQLGLEVNSTGAIKVSNLTANWNGGQGAWLYNRWNVALGGVSLTGVNHFEGNNGTGLLVQSYGNLTLSNLTAIGNKVEGAYLETESSSVYTTTKAVLTGTNVFSGNGDDVAHTGSGLVVHADGPITINNLISEGNASRGAALDNCLDSGAGCTGAGNLTLTGVNRFKGNYSTGLEVLSNGLVTLNKVTADNNGGTGVDLDTNGAVTWSCGSLTNNTVYGWAISTPLTVTLRGVFAYGNTASDTMLHSGTLIPIRVCP